MTATPTPAFRLQLSVDCADPTAMCAFWNLALGYIDQPPPPGFADWEAYADSVGLPAEEHSRFASSVDPNGVGPRLLFQRVPESKVVKNRWHPDVSVAVGLAGEELKAKVRSHAELLVAAGARIVAERQDEFSWWIVLTDIEGNEFSLQ